MQEFFFALFYTTMTQIFSVLGIFFVFGFVLSKLQEATHGLYHRSIGWKGILWTAWFGTPFHELGHIVFAKIFRHKIHHVTFFSPNEKTGSLGHVEHSSNPLSIYQRIGDFFIGAAPMIFGSALLILFLLVFSPDGTIVYTTLTEETNSLFSVLKNIPSALFSFFSLNNLREWHFWIFLYISFCIAAHIAPSKGDRKSMWKGLIWIVLLLLLINAITLLFGIDTTEFVQALNRFLGFFVAIFLYVLVISLLHYLLAALILGSIIRVKKGYY